MEVKRKVKQYLSEESSRSEEFETVEHEYLQYNTQHALARDLRECKRNLDVEFSQDLRRLLTDLIEEADKQLIRDSLLDDEVELRSDIQDYYILLDF